MHDLPGTDSRDPTHTTPVVWDRDVQRVLERLDTRNSTLYRPRRPTPRRGFVLVAVGLPVGALLLGVLAGWLVAGL